MNMRRSFMGLETDCDSGPIFFLHQSRSILRGGLLIAPLRPPSCHVPFAFPSPFFFFLVRQAEVEWTHLESLIETHASTITHLSLFRYHIHGKLNMKYVRLVHTVLISLLLLRKYFFDTFQ